jgi:GPI mannosyltransferase 3
MTTNSKVSQLEKWLWGIAGLLMIVMAYNSEGYYHPDEHYQLIEFALYKLGLAPKNGLAWEFGAQLRPGLQPMIATGIIAASHSCGINNPFTIVFLLRLLSGAIWLLLFWQAYKYILRNYGASNGQIWLILGLGLWFSLFLGVRFSSENWAGMALFAAVLVLLHHLKGSVWMWSLAGFLFMIAFCFRYQTGFAIVGIGAWLLWMERPNWRRWAALMAGGLAGWGVELTTDYWLYGQWVFAPYNYYVWNIAQGKAASFGVEAWYWYMLDLPWSMGPGIGIILLALMLFGAYHSYRSVWIWMIVPFFVLHCAMSHKELRFMFPMYWPFLVLVSIGIHHLWKEQLSRKVLQWTIGLLLLPNLALYGWRITQDAMPFMPYYHYLYESAKYKDVHLVSYKTASMYGNETLRLNFYQPKRLSEQYVDSPDLIENIPTNKKSVLLFKMAFHPLTLQKKKIKLVFTQAPFWAPGMNSYKKWKDRRSPWELYGLGE